MRSGDTATVPRRYRMRERLFDLGEDFTVEDESGRPAFRVDGKMLTLRKTFVLEDIDGHQLATIRQPLISLRDTVVIERPDEPPATVRRPLLPHLRPRFHVEFTEGDLEVEGTSSGMSTWSGGVARLSRGSPGNGFSSGTRTGSRSSPGGDPALMISIAVALEAFDEGE